MTWTHFSDNYPGAMIKTDNENIYIEEPKHEAMLTFLMLFDCSPYGEDFAIKELTNIEDVLPDAKTLILNKSKLYYINHGQFQCRY